MTMDDPSPACSIKEHSFCHGPQVAIRREGAPKWEAPLMTLRCGCNCHRLKGRAASPPQAPAAGTPPVRQRDDGGPGEGGPS